MNTLKTLIGMSGLIIALGGWSVANAATYTFNFTNTGGQTGTPEKTTATKSVNNDYTYYFTKTVSGSPSLTAIGYSKINNDIKNAKSLNLWDGGIGLINKNESNTNPQHTIDNQNGYDYILFQFNEAVKITDIVLGYVSGDGDIAYGTGNSGINGLTEIARTNGSFGDNPFSLTSYSNTWLIAASILNKDKFADQFKIKSITVETSTVPLPAAVWLFGSALLGMVGIGYRRQNQNKPI